MADSKTGKGRLKQNKKKGPTSFFRGRVSNVGRTRFFIFFIFLVPLTKNCLEAAFVGGGGEGDEKLLVFF